MFLNLRKKVNFRQGTGCLMNDLSVALPESEMADFHSHYRDAGMLSTNLNTVFLPPFSMVTTMHWCTSSGISSVFK